MRRYCEPKKLTRILMPTPFLYLNVFRYQKVFETQKGNSRNCFGSVTPKKPSGNLDVPNTLMHKKFLDQIFSETMKCSPTKCFGTVIQNISTENRDKPPPPMHETFWYQIFSQIQKGFPTKFFATMRKQIAGGKLYYLPLMHSFR